MILVTLPDFRKKREWVSESGTSATAKSGETSLETLPNTGKDYVPVFAFVSIGVDPAPAPAVA
jgi:hypothetical protein